MTRTHTQVQVGRGEVSEGQEVFLSQLAPTQRALNACSFALLEKDIALLCGESGSGKSAAVRMFCQTNERCRLFLSSAEFTYPQALFDHLVCDVLNISMKKRGLPQLFPAAVEALRKESLLVIDEADLLPPKCLSQLRRLHDLSGVGMVFVGLPTLPEMLRAPGCECRQLAERVGGFVMLSELNKTDAALLGYAICPDLDQRTMGKLYDSSRGNIRAFTKILKRAVHLAAMAESPIGPEHIRSAAELMLL